MVVFYLYYVSCLNINDKNTFFLQLVKVIIMQKLLWMENHQEEPKS